jgi:type I restriction enzyme M protein
MALKKSQLYSSLWQSCDELRGGMDASQYKDYILTLLFVVPPALIVARYFADEQAEIEVLQAKQEEATRELEEFIEEHAVEEGLLEAAANDQGKVTKGGVKERLEAIEAEPENDDEHAALKRCLELMDAESDAKKAVKDAQEQLDAEVLAKYADLSEDEVKTLAADDKWFTSIQLAIEGEVQRITQRLAERVKELEERYADTMPDLVDRVDALSSQVRGHLKKMGLWS